MNAWTWMTVAGLAFKLGGQTYGIGVGGQLAIPFWIAAIVRGKCH